MEKKNTIIISAFPGCGKSFCTNSEEFKSKYKMADSDSSLFHWIKDENGTKVENPNFINDYMNHIESLIGVKDVIFISSHKDVRDACFNKFKETPIILIYPHNSEENKKIWLERYRQRGSSEDFIKQLDINWDSWLNEINTVQNYSKDNYSQNINIYKLPLNKLKSKFEGKFTIADVLDKLLSLKY